MEVKKLKSKKIFLNILLFVVIVVMLNVCRYNFCVINGHIYNKKIQSIDLKGQTLVKNDLQKLSALHNVEELDIYNACITDISFLYDLKKLKRLYIGGRISTDITDWSPLQSCNQLKYLRAWDTDFENLYNIRELSNLEVLDLCEGNNVSDIEDIVFLVNLKEVHLSSNNLNDITPLEQLELIEEIYIYSSSIEELPDFSNCMQLNTLTLCGCGKLKDMDSLANSSIEKLNILGTMPENYSFLFEMPKLSELIIGKEALNDEEFNDLVCSGITIITD